MFSTAFVYDVALAVCAALTGTAVPDAWPRRSATDSSTPWITTRSTTNIGSQFGFVGTAVGDMAWPGIALVHLYRRTWNRRYLRAAVRIGE